MSRRNVAVPEAIEFMALMICNCCAYWPALHQRARRTRYRPAEMRLHFGPWPVAVPGPWHRGRC